MGTTRVDLTGRRFGRLSVVGESHSSSSVHWHVACDCGSRLVRRGGDLLVRERRGQNQSCGCARARVIGGGLIRCGKCGERKGSNEFRVDKSASAGVHGHCRACQDEWRANNKDLLRELGRSYAARNPGKIRQNCAGRRAAKRRAQPAWADGAAIAAIYVEAARTGMHVDHIVPLQSDLVCGLHVENNLQLLLPSDNHKKGNRWWPDMPAAIE